MEQKKEGNKNLPALIPSFSLTDEQSNIVIYSIKNIEKEIFCEGVAVINGWVTMTNLRVKKSFVPKLKFVRPVGSYSGAYLKECLGVTPCHKKVYLGGTPCHKEFTIEGYDNLASRTLPQKNVDNIDSFNQEQQKLLPLWALTSREQAFEEANKKVEEWNERTLKSNAMKFSYIVRSLLEEHLVTLIPGWRRKFFLVDQKEWTDERRKQPDMQEKIDELIKDVEIVFNNKNVEFDGDLHYDATLGEKIYNRYGKEIDSRNIYERYR
jgi:hypothetical protein